ncbi:DeoR/GlpR family DNA-binding transcription regulator [Vibrio furnissii]|uniref:DeoR/GlpR family DNA-binding transcription regulator n=1 Tax=Vibrio furnissii TaxID=29494 RepID=UPI00117FAB8A|nr:DeoR/GlpR family DNA-binding transcription regulator [Vibrio furnissii]TRN24793.1 DeoR/GlpR transcriptional regulator [Vibrio furnissii]
MTQEERLIHLQMLIKQQGKMTLTDICDQFGVSRDSARRDLVKLTQLPGIQRIRGGAMLAPVSPKSEPFAAKTVSASKHALAQCVASMVDAQDYIVLDTSTTLALVPGYLAAPATIVTNSVNTLAQVEEGASYTVHLLGGHFDPYSRAILGPQAEQQMAGYHVNKAFIGVCALSERGLTTNYEQEASMKRAMMAQAQQIILVCEQRKMGTENFHHVCDVAAIDMVITDAPPAPALQELFDRHDIQCVVATAPEGQF